MYRAWGENKETVLFLSVPQFGFMTHSKSPDPCMLICKPRKKFYSYICEILEVTLGR